MRKTSSKERAKHAHQKKSGHRYTHTHTHTRTHARTHARKHARTHTHTHTLSPTFRPCVFIRDFFFLPLIKTCLSKHLSVLSWGVFFRVFLVFLSVTCLLLVSTFFSFFTTGTPVAAASPKPKTKTLTSLRFGKVFFGEEMKEARRLIGDLPDTCKVVVMTLQDLDDTCKVTLMTLKDPECLPALRLVLYELLAVLMLWYIHQRTGVNNVTHSSTTDKAWRGFFRSTFVSRQRHTGSNHRKMYYCSLFRIDLYLS